MRSYSAAALLVLTEELSEEKEGVKALAAERDKCEVVFLMLKLDLKACIPFEATNACYSSSNEEFERMTNHLLQ